MNTGLSSLSVFGALVLVSGLTCVSAGCGGAQAEGPAVGMAGTTGATVDTRTSENGHATASLALAVRSEDDDSDDNPRGTVIVDADVIQSCQSVRAVKVKKEDTMAWLHILKSVARCMNDGELKSRHLVLHGPTRPQVIVKYMLSRLGVTEDRVDLTTVPGERTCNDDCDPSEMRVDIGIAGAANTVSQAL